MKSKKEKFTIIEQVSYKEVKAKAPEVKLEYGEHFPIRLIQRLFDLSVLIPLYKEICRQPIGGAIKLTIGRATVCAIRTKADTAFLKTGW